MKKLHLLCNAHLDPAWLWQRDEGLCEAISTFRVAADFCEQYDGFVFNHNESILYEWVEKYEPQLFERIKKLVKEGKWTIMGGWYLQPDCTMPSGESFLSQINIGREYFKEKFGVVPKTAINFDPFGHTRGLVQILEKTGFNSYIFMRPYEIEGDFVWKGFADSEVIAHGIIGPYNTSKGEAVETIKEYVKAADTDVGLCLWGIGNHGGGPSRIDLERINEYMKSAGFDILHSSPEAYFKEVDKSKIKTIKDSLGPAMVGCYTSMVRIKQAHRQVENKIAATEKIMSYADLLGVSPFDEKALLDAKKALAFCQFHDILPGSAVKTVEEDSLKTLGYAEEITEKIYLDSFLKLCDGQKAGKTGEFPIMIFNPHPYEITDVFEAEFMLEDKNWSQEEVTIGHVYDKDKNFLPTQNEKPLCTFSVDWRKKISFRATLSPSSINRFDCMLTMEKIKEPLVYDGDTISVKNAHMHAVISKKTGLIELYELDGIPYIKNSGKLMVYKDNEDSWYMEKNSFDTIEGAFSLLSDKEANEFIGYPEENISNVRVIEDGPVRIKIQAIFGYKRSVAVVEYSMPKEGAYIDVNISLLSNIPNKMVKYRIDTEFKGTPYGDTAFGTNKLYSDGTESTYQKWCAIKNEDMSLCVLNKGIYGGSFSDSSISLSLLRTPLYSSHPLPGRIIAPRDKFIDHIDLGQRNFSFRISAQKDVGKEAQIFNEAPRLLTFFPSGMGVNKNKSAVKIDNPFVLLSSMRRKEGKLIITVYNSSPKPSEATVELLTLNKKIEVSLKGHEFKIIEI